MKKIILNRENVNDIKYASIIAITIAEGGAMGDPNGVEIILRDMSYYYFNLSNTNIDIKKFFNDNPVFDSIKYGVGGIIEIDKEWKWFDMGFGNYLVIRKEYYEKYRSYLIKKDGNKYNTGKFYNIWYEILKEVLMQN